MIDKSKSSLSEVLSQIKDGATILIGGFGTAGQVSLYSTLYKYSPHSKQ
ncbi:hypothetical protein GSE42_10990 [Acinetobacter baumannii]|uniref:3-oxoadipate CoA-transferase n=1 Tax=Acinetobacter baumannii TaxID=470 RepID=A0A6L8MBR7_ACIBA|nr:hypothetical protein [Acinetobacter baumannii]